MSILQYIPYILLSIECYSWNTPNVEHDRYYPNIFISSGLFFILSIIICLITRIWFKRFSTIYFIATTILIIITNLVFPPFFEGGVIVL